MDDDMLDLFEEPDIDASEMGTSADLVRHPSGIIPAVSHVVCQFNLGLKVHLMFLNIKLPNTRYTYEAYPTKRRRPSRFRRLMLELFEPSGPSVHLGIFNTGKVRIFGAKSEDKARLAARALVKKLRRFQEYKAATVLGFKVENYVAGTVAELFGPLNLSLLNDLLNRLPEAPFTTNSSESQNKEAARSGSRPEFEPEIFNALRYKTTIDGNKVCVKVFASGSVRIVGCRTLDTLHQLFEYVYPILVRTKRVTTDAKPRKVRVVWKEATTS